ncbi:UNVERIFIED_CONTAM: hypothetical protein Sradi_1379600, partial [Sesamum radiatum]
MYSRVRRLRHMFWVLPKIYPGASHRLSGVGINVLADGRSTASWFNGSYSIYRWLEFAGCQGQRYSTVSETKHKMLIMDDVLSFIRSSLHQPRFGQTVVKFSKESGSASSIQFSNFGILGLPYWLASSLEQVYAVDDQSGDLDHSQCFRLLPGKVDIDLNVDVPQHTDLVEQPQEGCIWRQARGAAAEVSGVENKAASSEQVGAAQQWYDEIDNLSFSTPPEESSKQENSRHPGEEVQDGRVRIGCTINTSPGTSEVIIYAALYLRLKKSSNPHLDTQDSKAARIAEILEPKRKSEKDLLVKLMMMSERDLEELVFMRPLHVRLKFNCRDHPKADNTKGVILTDSSVKVHVTL